ncbi:DASS family sodium-coupled anion symporter [Propionivibrio sp.]|uniref:DASS family sodium-coupled anion symporter n=1 Tax=Propionivibrio sp. TaxID=2212460 RepID=UPI0039E2C517
MNTKVMTQAVGSGAPAAAGQKHVLSRYGLHLGVAFLLLIVLLPQQPGLPVAGHYMLGILAFAVTVWMTEAVSYPVSAVVITALMAFMLGFAPDVAKPDTLMGTSKGLSIALGGFSNTAWALVGGALFLAAAMTRTGLDRRIALLVLSKVGAQTSRILIGVIFIGFVLSFFVPSTTARVSGMVPIVMGIIVAFGVPLRSRFAGMLMIAVAQADSLWNVGIKTAAAQNMVAVSFIEKQLGVNVSWLDWFIAAAPFSAIMSVVLYFILMKMMPPEKQEIEGGRAIVAKALQDLGPMRAEEKRLLAISLVLLFFWATEKLVHPFDTSTTTIAAIALMFLPRVGVMDWKEVQNAIPWGTLVLFGIGISLGSALLSTKAAPWLATWISAAFGLQTASALMILAVLALFLILIHLGFASATGLAAAMIPIVISVLQSVQTPGINVVGMTMILQYVVSFGMILPVNAPQNMVVYGTDTFEVRDFVRTGIPLTVIAYLLVLLMGATYWRWLGYVGG